MVNKAENKGDKASLFDEVMNERVISESVIEYMFHNANTNQVTMAEVAELLKILKARVEIGQTIVLAGLNNEINKDNFDAWLEKSFSPACRQYLEDKPKGINWKTFGANK